MTEHDPVAAAADLTESLDGLTRQMSRLTRSEKQWRRVVIALAVSLCLDLLLTLGLGYIAIRQDATQNTSHSDLLSACRQANVNRTQDRAVWDVILKVPANAKPATKAELAKLDHLVTVKDKLRDCAVLYRTGQ